MKILAVHNHYRQPGGEDELFRQETALLEERGHQVLRFSVRNDGMGEGAGLGLARDTVWNRRLYRDLRALVRAERPAVAHFHNTFPLISPAAYWAVKAEGVPVLQTLQNYRLVCPNAMCFRDGRLCRECVGRRIPWPAVLHACYRESRAASAVVAAMLAGHRALGTYQSKVDVYVAPSQFVRERCIEGGLPAARIQVKPNFAHPDPGLGSGDGDYALFAGRLSPEKGVETLLAAWELLKAPLALKVLGEGPLAGRVAALAGRDRCVEGLGWRPHAEMIACLRRARLLIVPSVWHEPFPIAVVEAFAVGLPVIASGLESLSSMVDHGRTGLRFRPGDPEDLAAKIEWTLARPVELARMRIEARAEFEARYTGEKNYQRLMEIYETARQVSAAC